MTNCPERPLLVVGSLKLPRAKLAQRLIFGVGGTGSGKEGCWVCNYNLVAKQNCANAARVSLKQGNSNACGSNNNMRCDSSVHGLLRFLRGRGVLSQLTQVHDERFTTQTFDLSRSTSSNALQPGVLGVLFSRSVLGYGRSIRIMMRISVVVVSREVVAEVFGIGMRNINHVAGVSISMDLSLSQFYISYSVACTVICSNASLSLRASSSSGWSMSSSSTVPYCALDMDSNRSVSSDS